jgi:hypothetical protein
VAATFSLPRQSYAAGTYQGTIDAGAGHAGAFLTIDNSAWLPGTSATISVAASSDAGVTFPDVAITTITDQSQPISAVQLEFVWSNGGVTKPTVVQVTVNLNQTATTAGSGGWL